MANTRFPAFSIHAYTAECGRTPWPATRGVVNESASSLASHAGRRARRILTRVVFAVVFFHDAFAAEAQVHLGPVGTANRIVIVPALELALASRRYRRRRAGRL